MTTVGSSWFSCYRTYNITISGSHVLKNVCHSSHNTNKRTTDARKISHIFRSASQGNQECALGVKPALFMLCLSRRFLYQRPISTPDKCAQRSQRKRDKQPMHWRNWFYLEKFCEITSLRTLLTPTNMQPTDFYIVSFSAVHIDARICLENFRPAHNRLQCLELCIKCTHISSDKQTNAIIIKCASQFPAIIHVVCILTALQQSWSSKWAAPFILTDCFKSPHNFEYCSSPSIILLHRSALQSSLVQNRARRNSRCPGLSAISCLCCPSFSYSPLSTNITIIIIYTYYRLKCSATRHFKSKNNELHSIYLYSFFVLCFIYVLFSLAHTPPLSLCIKNSNKAAPSLYSASYVECRQLHTNTVTEGEAAAAVAVAANKRVSRRRR